MSFKKFRVLILLSILLLQVSCERNNIPESTKRILELSGKNKESFIAVLKTYSKVKDSLKFKAACYLIENMENHSAYYYKSNSHNDLFIELGKKSLGNLNRRALWDSIAPVLQKIDYSKIKKYSDLENMTSEVLFDHIEGSFYAWENYPWCVNLSFEELKTYILPYRAANEPLEICRKRFQKKYSWVLDSINNPKDMQEAFTLIYNDFYSWFETVGNVGFPLTFTYTQTENAKTGLCDDGCNLLLMIMRSMGIKAVYDFSVQWSNRKSAVHSWIAYAQDEKNTLFIDQHKKLTKPKHIHSAKFVLDKPGTKFIPKGESCQQFKKGTKVRRNTFNINRKSIYFENIHKESIPQTLNDLFSIDVTNHYIDNASIRLNCPDQYNGSYIFLAVFSRMGLYPVEWTKVIDGSIQFNSIGTDGIYYTLINDTKGMLNLLPPFLLDKKGQVNFLEIDKQNTQTLHLKRKYPLFGNTLNHMNKMFKAVIQGANKKDFSDSDDLYTIHSTITTPTYITIDSKKAYRYFRYLPQPHTTGDIAELNFFKLEQGKYTPLKGLILYKEEGHHNQDASKAFDNDYNSFYMSRTKGTWIGLDLGAGNKSFVNRIKISPRSDTNFIIKGQDYELMYWDGKWVSMGKKKADTYSLSFKNVPSNTIYWLKCLSGGSEERPFTYENNNQIWW